MEIDQGVDLDNPTQRALEDIPLNELLSKRGGKIDLLLGMPVFGKSLGEFLRACLIHLFF